MAVSCPFKERGCVVGCNVMEMDHQAQHVNVSCSHSSSEGEDFGGFQGSPVSPQPQELPSLAMPHSYSITVNNTAAGTSHQAASLFSPVCVIFSEGLKPNQRDTIRCFFFRAQGFGS